MFAKAVLCAVLLGFAAAEWTPEDYVATLGADAPMLNYFVHPTDCQAYYLAFRVNGAWQTFSFQCSAGQIWKNDLKACIPGTCGETTIDCSVDGALLPDPDNCASFYHCSNGVAYQKCCPAGLAWNATEKICDFIGSCTQTPSCPTNDEAEAITTTLGPEPVFCMIGDYIYEKVDGNPNLYKLTNNVTGTPVVESTGQACPFDHVFSTRECGCLNTQPVVHAIDDRASCVLLNFETSLSTPSVWVGQTQTGCEMKDGQLCFTGEGYINIPFYNNVAFNKKIEVSFNYSSDSTDDFIFVANGMTVADSSFCIYQEQGNLKCKITTAEGVFVVGEKAVEGLVSVKYDNENLFLIVDGTEAKVTATGSILRKTSDLIVGSQFVGCIDDFDFCPMQ